MSIEAAQPFIMSANKEMPGGGVLIKFFDY